MNRDWTEDFEYENGNYSCICQECGNEFIGYKRRTTCKKCHMNHDHSQNYNNMLKYWEEYNIKPIPQYIVCAANRIKTKKGIVILTGARHWDSIMRRQADHLGIKGGNEEQGFIDQFGTFLTREEAMEIVKKNGQKFDKESNRGDKSLCSEGLY